MDENLEKRKENIQHFMKVIDVSAKLNINMVTGFLEECSINTRRKFKGSKRNMDSDYSLCRKQKSTDCN